MEFWGIEVKPGQSVKSEPGDDKLLHLSQAALGETKKEKANEGVPIFVKANGEKLIIGTLSAEKCPQIQYDLVFEKEFELSHGSKNASVFFCGYKTLLQGPYDSDSEEEMDTDEEEDVIPMLRPNGKPEGNDKAVKPEPAKPAAKAVASSSKPKVTIEEPKNEISPDEDDDSDDDEDDDEDDDDESSEEDPFGGDEPAEDDSEDDEDDDIDEEDTPKKPTSGKKRAAEAVKTPVAEKKTKVATPAGGQKTGGDGKKGGHVATPHPAKQIAKTPVTNDKSKQQQTPKSAGSVACKSCNKSFNSDNALQSHTKAKHAAK